MYDIQVINKKIKDKEIEIKILKEKNKNTQTNLDELIQEGDKQIKELTKITEEQEEEIKQFKSKILMLEIENEDQTEIIKFTEEENKGLTLAVASLNNAISSNKRRSYCGNSKTTKPVLGFNNSLSFSLLEHDQTPNSNKTLQDEIEETSILQNHQNILKSQNNENKKKKEKATNKGKTIIQQENENSENRESPPNYIATEIIIENNKELQEKLENEDIIKKKKKLKHCC